MVTNQEQCILISGSIEEHGSFRQQNLGLKGVGWSWVWVGTGPGTEGLLSPPPGGLMLLGSAGGHILLPGLGTGRRGQEDSSQVTLWGSG